MATLTFTINSRVHGGLLASRVLIGRRLANGLLLSDPSVSRLHAWIDPVDDPAGGWTLADAGSKTGTFVNDQKILTHRLRDNDIIRIGRVTVTYHDADMLPAGAAVLDLSVDRVNPGAEGILFKCACGSPLWVGNELAGKRGICRYCRKPVTVPKPKPISLPAPAAAKVATNRHAAKCAVCHSPIATGESVTQCPDCAMVFHAECWQENLGCSTYGCQQVDALKPREAAEPLGVSTDPTEPANQEMPSTQWDLILLAGSIVSAVLGAAVFGSLSAIVAGACVFRLINVRQRRIALLAGALLISVSGIVIGLAVSDLWYFDARHLPAMLRR